MCFCALYEDLTNALLSTCLKPKSNPIFSYSKNSPSGLGVFARVSPAQHDFQAFAPTE